MSMSPLFRRLLVVGLLILPILALSSAAGADEAPVAFAPLHALSPDDAPLRLNPVRTYDDAVAPGKTRRLSVGFYVENTSDRPILSVDYDLVIFAAEGWPRGMFTYSQNLHAFHAGEKRFVMIGTDQWSIRPTDRVVIVPVEVRFLGAPVWRPELDRTNVREIFLRPEDSMVLDALVAPSETGPGDLSCETKCINQEERCKATCICGVRSQSCSCSEGSFESRCDCFGPCAI